MTSIFLTNALLIAGIMLLMWLLSVPLKDVSIIDLVWGLGFVVVAWSTYLQSTGEGPSRWLLLIMATLWGLRLSGYLAWRNLGHGEDARYAKMREHSGERFWMTSLFKVFLLQGVVMWVVSLPLQVGVFQAHPGWHVLHGIGFGLWSVGLFFETVGDWQLACFKSDPQNKGNVLDRGLWRYTRHPNYFGDFCVWWGLYLVAIAHGVALWTILSPIVMSIFLMKVSGVGLLEKSLKESKPTYEDYIRRTSPFFPLPPQA